MRTRNFGVITWIREKRFFSIAGFVRRPYRALYSMAWCACLSVCLCLSVLFFSRPRSDGWPYHGRTFSVYLCLSSVILIDSSTGSPVHVLMLSIQAVRRLPRFRAPGIVPCIISFSRQLRFCYKAVFCQKRQISVISALIVTKPEPHGILH